jgi:hypothetical protein
MRAEDLVNLVEHKGLVGLQDALGCSRGRAESLDVEARRLVGLGFGQSEVGRSLTASAMARQQATQPSALPVNPDVERVLRALDRMERAPTGDEIASRLDADRRREVERRNAEGAEQCRAYAATLRASGYAGWTGGDR